MPRLGQVADAVNALLLAQVMHRCGTYAHAACGAYEFEGAVRVVVFDDGAIRRVIGNIDANEWIILIVLAAVRFLPEGWVYVAAYRRQGANDPMEQSAL